MVVGAPHSVVGTYWGKADPAVSGGFHTTLAHSLDVAAAAFVLVEQRALFRRALARHVGLGDDEVQSTLAFVASLHDIGKLDARFQHKCPDLARSVYATVSGAQRAAAERASRGFDHGLAGTWYVRYGKLRAKLGDGTADLVEAACAHHGTFPFLDESTCADVSCFRDAAEQDSAARNGLVRACHGLFAGLGGRLAIPAKMSPVALMLVAGLVSFCDWLGSDVAYFPYEPDANDADVYWPAALSRARTAFCASGLEAARPRARSFHDLFGFEPRDVQTLLPNVSCDGPSLVLIEARMGSGKTEAALSLVSRWMQSGVVDGMYAALPTMATANGLFERVCGFSGRAFHGEVHVRLAHGRAKRQPAFQALFSAPFRAPRRTRGDTPGDDTASVLCARWLLSRKRALLAQVGVGTVDQALLAALIARHHFVGLAGLSSHALVVDEVHAYDAYMQTVLDRLLVWLGAFGSPVVLLSATLPDAVKCALRAAYQRGLGLPVAAVEHTPEAYPLVTVVTAGKTQYLVLPEAPAAQPVALELLRTESPEEAVASRIIEAVRAKARVVWIRNTVREAQEAYRVLSSEVANTLLFHARFRSKDRAEKEHAVLSGFGKDGSRDSGLVIATQVVEQSLDLDFDWLVTDLAPTDLILQRAGRLHRHEQRRRPAGFSEPRVLVVLPPEEQSEQLAYGGSGRVYARSTLWITEQVLSERQTLVLPADIRGLVEATYGERAREERFAGAPNARRLRDAEASRLAELDDYRGKAERVAIRAPDERFVPERTQDDDALLAIRTRLGVSQQLLPVLWDAETCSASTLDGTPLPKDPEGDDAFRKADALLEEMVAVSGQRFDRGGDPPGETEPWSAERQSVERFLGAVGLEETLVVPFWPQGSGYQGRVLQRRDPMPTRVTYDRDRGLVLP